MRLFADTPFLTNETIFELKKLPDSLIVLGAGPIGSEMAQALNRLGVKVTLIEKYCQILSRDDAELAKLLMQRMVDGDWDHSCPLDPQPDLKV